MSFAHIRDVGALRELRDVLARFAQGSDALSLARSLLTQRIEQMACKVDRCQGEVYACEERLSDAEHALDRADQSDEEGGDPYCDWERENVGAAKRAIREAQSRTDECRSLLRKAVEIREQWLPFERALSFQLMDRLPVAVHAAGQLVEGADDYLAIVAAPVASVAVAGAMGEGLSSVSAAKSIGSAASLIQPLTQQLLAYRTLRGASGETFELRNEVRGREVIATLSGSWGNQECSRLLLEHREGGLVATIASVNLPHQVAQENLGSALVQNLESVARAADCSAISVWASGGNADFFRRLGYEAGTGNARDGAELSRELSSSFSARQAQHAHAFSAVADAPRSGSNEPLQVNPLDVLVSEDITQPGFWRRKKLDVEDYVELIGQWRDFSRRRAAGETEEHIRATDWRAGNARDIFMGTEPVQLARCGTHFAVVNGAHRVAAAQLHYLSTGEIVYLPAFIIDIYPDPP